jgi:hypothetical protein
VVVVEESSSLWVSGGGGKTGRTQRQERLLQVRLSVVLRSRRGCERTRPSFGDGLVSRARSHNGACS